MINPINDTTQAAAQLAARHPEPPTLKPRHTAAPPPPGPGTTPPPVPEQRHPLPPLPGPQPINADIVELSSAAKALSHKS